MWIPAQTTTPPFLTARSPAGTSAPTGAKIRVASRRTGGASSEPPAQAAPRVRAKACPSASPGLVNAKTSRPCWTATWVRMWAAPPKP